MKFSKAEGNTNKFKPLEKLIQLMLNDPLIHDKVITLLQMDSYQRRSVLNDWLEQLKIRKAPENLLSALCYLFDDKIAREVLVLINKRKK